MSAEILRRAAALMRERVGRTSNGVVEGWYAYLRADEGSVRTRIDNHTWTVAETDWPGDAEHIASWHPAVALAVADVLHMAADHLEGRGNPCDSCVEQAVVVARAYLGEAADD